MHTIEISAKAIDQLVEMNVSHSQFLRLWVTEGCCQGQSYQAAIDEKSEDGDTVLYTDDRIKVVSDPQSAQLFAGLHIDYSDEQPQVGFRFTNSQQKSECGCGSRCACE